MYIEITENSGRNSIEEMDSEPGVKLGRNKDSDVENWLEDMGSGKGKMGQSESGMDIYTLPNVK